MTHVAGVRAVTSLRVGTSLQLQDERATLHRVDEDIAALEQSVAGPCANKVDLPSASCVVVLRVDVYIDC